jgi:hypothetical protein
VHVIEFNFLLDKLPDHTRYGLSLLVLDFCEAKVDLVKPQHNLQSSFAFDNLGLLVGLFQVKDFLDLVLLDPEFAVIVHGL